MYIVHSDDSACDHADTHPWQFTATPAVLRWLYKQPLSGHFVHWHLCHRMSSCHEKMVLRLMPFVLTITTCS